MDYFVLNSTRNTQGSWTALEQLTLCLQQHNSIKNFSKHYLRRQYPSETTLRFVRLIMSPGYGYGYGFVVRSVRKNYEFGSH